MKKILDNGAELQYCPFCGGEPNLHIMYAMPPKRIDSDFTILNLKDYKKIYYICCEECGNGTQNCESAEKAIEEWNKAK